MKGTDTAERALAAAVGMTRERQRMALDLLGEEVDALYIRRINHELSDEEAAEYQEKDRLYCELERAMR